MEEKKYEQKISPETLLMGQLDVEDVKEEISNFDFKDETEQVENIFAKVDIGTSKEDFSEVTEIPEQKEERTSDACEMEEQEVDLDSGSELVERISALETAVGGFKEMMEKIVVNGDLTARQLNTVNENLHRENQKLKEGLYDSLVLPVIKDVIGFLSDVLRNVERYRKMGQQDVADALQDMVEDMNLMLESHDVEVYVPEVGDFYEPLIHKIQETEETTDVSKDRMIRSVRGYGYQYIKNEKPTILSPCRVSVYKYKKEEQ